MNKKDPEMDDKPVVFYEHSIGLDRSMVNFMGMRIPKEDESGKVAYYDAQKRMVLKFQKSKIAFIGVGVDPHVPSFEPPEEEESMEDALNKIAVHGTPPDQEIPIMGMDLAEQGDRSPEGYHPPPLEDSEMKKATYTTQDGPGEAGKDNTSCLDPDRLPCGCVNGEEVCVECVK